MDRSGSLPIALVVGCLAVFTTLLLPTSAVAGCRSNDDCKGRRVCIQSSCTDLADPCDKDTDCRGVMICDFGGCVPPKSGGESSSSRATEAPRSKDGVPSPTSGGSSSRSTRRDDRSSSDRSSGGDRRDADYLTSLRERDDFRFPEGAKVLVLHFKDNDSNDSNDRDGSGQAAQDSFVEHLRDQSGIKVKGVALPRDRSPGEGYSRDEAVQVLREEEGDFVIWGLVTAFYNVAPMTYRADTAGVWFEVVDDRGRVEYRKSRVRVADTNFHNPEWCLSRIAEDEAGELRPR